MVCSLDMCDIETSVNNYSLFTKACNLSQRAKYQKTLPKNASPAPDPNYAGMIKEYLINEIPKRVLEEAEKGETIAIIDIGRYMRSWKNVFAFRKCTLTIDQLWEEINDKVFQAFPIFQFEYSKGNVYISWGRHANVNLSMKML